MRRALLVMVFVTGFGWAVPTPASACTGEVCELVCGAADVVVHKATGDHVECR